MGSIPLSICVVTIDRDMRWLVVVMGKCKVGDRGGVTVEGWTGSLFQSFTLEVIYFMIIRQIDLNYRGRGSMALFMHINGVEEL